MDSISGFKVLKQQLRKAWKDNPEKLQAVNKKFVDDAQVLWTTHCNLEQRFEDAKHNLIDNGLGVDREVRDPDGTHLEILVNG